MKPLKPKSARALIWLAAIILVVGGLVSSPSGAFCAFFIAMVLAAFPTILGSGKLRIVAGVLLLISLGLTVGKYPDFRSEQKDYRERAR